MWNLRMKRIICIVLMAFMASCIGRRFCIRVDVCDLYHVFIGMILMDMVQMTIMCVVCVARMLDANMSAITCVSMGVAAMFCAAMIGGCRTSGEYNSRKYSDTRFWEERDSHKIGLVRHLETKAYAPSRVMSRSKLCYLLTSRHTHM